MKDNVLNLQTHAKNIELPRYLIITCSPKHQIHLQALTPMLMQWSSRIYILDISTCQRFWERQAAKLGLTPFEMIHRILLQSFGQKLRAVAASHPWPGLFLHAYLREKKLAGFINLHGPFGATLYREASWTAWLRPLPQLMEHWLVTRLPKPDPALFRSHIGRLERAMLRLDIATPAALRQAAATAMKRRFGSLLAEVWEWTSFTQRSDEPATLFDEQNFFEDGFPWRGWQPDHCPMVRRNLDEPVWQWDHLEPLLKEDLDRLCQDASWSMGERVTELSWQITLYGMEAIEIPIRFRNPHALHAEKGQHKTTLYQALYSYEAFTRQWAAEHDQSEDISPPFVSWTLTLKNRMRVSQHIIDLFGTSQSDDVLALENKLPMPLLHYRLKPDFQPHTSFCTEAEFQSYAFSLESWRLAATLRPLFFSPTPTACPPPKHCTLRFLERTSVDWWLSEDPHDVCHDYFMLTDASQRSQWVFRNTGGKWYSHGFFD